MPPTLTASLNPVDHPAFSPAYTPEPLALQLGRHFGTTTTSSATSAATTITSSRSVGRIPYTFFKSQQATSAQVVQQTRNLNNVLSVNQPHPSQAYPPWSYYASANMPEPASDLPEIPKWALGILAGALTFLFVVAIVLFAAQFPPRWLRWLRDVKRRWQGYTRLDTTNEYEYEFSGEVVGAKSSAVAPSPSSSSSATGRFRGSGLKKRRPRLSIDTGVGVAYDGLGVIVAADDDSDGDGAWHTALQTRHSYDKEALCVQRTSPVTLNWQSLTAPLPSIQTFGGHSSGNRDVESATSDPNTEAMFSSRSAPPTTTTPDFLKYLSHLNYNDDVVDYPGSALFRRVNEGIYTAADRLSRAFYEQVNRAEEGLLLPVREGERERVGGSLLDRGVVVG